ncbi:MAG: hypothetical protein RR280_08465 [Bacteroidaceae bacterium]
MKDDMIYLKRMLSSDKRNYVLPLLLVIVTAITYYPVCFNQLQEGWDDLWQVTNCYTSGGFGWDNIKPIFTESYYMQYSPVNQCMYILIYHIGRFNPEYYHLASLLLHIFNVVLVYYMSNSIFSTKCFGNVEHKQAIAFIAALLFAVNPLQVESVAWVSASKIVLYSFFYLSASLVYLKFIDSSKWYYYLASIVLFLLSYGSKEQAVVFPLWLVLLHWVKGSDFKHWKTYASILPFFLLSATFGFVFMFIVSSVSRDLDHFVKIFDFFERIEIACFTIAVYLRRWFAPYDLSYFYPIPNEMPTWFMVFPICFAVVTLTLLLKAEKCIKFCLIFFVLHLFLTLHIVPMDRVTIMADRYMYLPTLGISWVIGFYAVQWYKHRQKWKTWIILSLTIMTLYMATYSNVRSRQWYNSASIKK